MKIKVWFSLSLLTLLSLFISRFQAGSIGMMNSASAQGVLESLEENITTLVESVKPSLVTIEAEVFPGNRENPTQLTSFVGSGVVYSSDGYILTTSSVVRGMKDFKVTLSNDKSYRAKLIGTDFQTNLAVLKIESQGLRIAKFGNSDRIREGSWVTVVGNSYGLP
ncbi:MAG TPA: trypsin-like peptidase domain-containing protein, partial [candidate division Zixibacteria bacterium]